MEHSLLRLNLFPSLGGFRHVTSSPHYPQSPESHLRRSTQARRPLDWRMSYMNTTCTRPTIMCKLVCERKNVTSDVLYHLYCVLWLVTLYHLCTHTLGHMGPMCVTGIISRHRSIYIEHLLCRPQAPDSSRHSEKLATACDWIRKCAK